MPTHNQETHVKPGAKVFAARAWDRVGLKRGMRGVVFSVSGDASFYVLWDDLLAPYPNGVWHYPHHAGYTVKPIVPAGV